MAINLSGMASGLDTDSIVTQLMAIEQNKVTAVQRRQIAVTQHKTDLTTIKTRLDALKTAAADLSASALWKPAQTTASSDPTKVDVTILGGAGIGGHSIQVDRLASSAQHGFNYTPSSTAGKLTVYYGTEPDTTVAPTNSKVEIDVPADATATQIATAINANDSAPVYAAVVKDNGVDKLVFSSRKTGDNANFSVDTSQMGAGAVFSEDMVYQRVLNLNASIKVDGGAELNPDSNVLENVIPGVRVTLKGLSTSPVSVTTTQPTVDTSSIAKKVTALVDAYNAVVTATRSELTEKRIPTASSSADIQKGQLFGDSGLNSMLGSLKSQMLAPLAGLGLTGLADLGISVPKSTGGVTTQEAKDGKLTIDTDKLNAAIAADYTKVRDLFAGKGAATPGLSKVLGDYVGTQTGATGSLTSRMGSDDTRLKGFTDQIAKLNARMATEEKRLKAQFAAMESALNASQTQQAWLTSQIASLP